MPGMGLGIGLGLSSNNRSVTATTLSELSHELLLPLELLQVTGSIEDGAVIKVLAYPWRRIFEQIEKNPDLLFEFSNSPRAFEEFIAGAYEKAGFDKVVLTPASGDLGRDVIAEKHGFGTVRILDQCKAFSKGRKVSANDVRAMMGTLFRDTNATNAVVTTTSEFAPGVYKEWANNIGHELTLRNGTELLDWLK